MAAPTQGYVPSASRFVDASKPPSASRKLSVNFHVKDTLASCKAAGKPPLQLDQLFSRKLNKETLLSPDFEWGEVPVSFSFQEQLHLYSSPFDKVAFFNQTVAEILGPSLEQLSKEQCPELETEIINRIHFCLALSKETIGMIELSEGGHIIPLSYYAHAKIQHMMESKDLPELIKKVLERLAPPYIPDYLPKDLLAKLLGCKAPTTDS